MRTLVLAVFLDNFSALFDRDCRESGFSRQNNVNCRVSYRVIIYNCDFSFLCFCLKDNLNGQKDID